MIEEYYHENKGYNPYLIRNGWQVAQLNYVEQHGLDDMNTLEIHHETDEVFILFEGIGVLIAADVKDDQIKYELINMKKGVAYNIPAGRWHNIGMNKDAKMVIVEKSDTHLNDCTLYELNESQREDLYRKVKDVL